MDHFWKLPMQRSNMLLLTATLLSCVVAVVSQCEDDSHCADGSFCDLSVYRCTKCLPTCQSLKREPPPFPNLCIKSISECGPCLKEMVENPKGELECVVPTDQSSSTVGWIVGGVVVALIVALLAGFIIKYILNHSDIFKFKVDTNIEATLPPVQYVAPTAPESPPPYSPPRPNDDLPPFPPGEDTSYSLMKPFEPPPVSVESQDRQKVSMFNAPAYVRLPNGNNGLRPSEGYNDVNENYAPLIHDEDTSPSPWAPGDSYNDNNASPSVNAWSTSSQAQDIASAGGDFSTGLAIARNTDLIQPPPVTVRTQFVNGEEGASGDGEPHHGPQGCTRPGGNASGNYNFMNVNQVITIIKPQ